MLKLTEDQQNSLSLWINWRQVHENNIKESQITIDFNQSKIDIYNERIELEKENMELSKSALIIADKTIAEINSKAE